MVVDTFTGLAIIAAAGCIGAIIEYSWHAMHFDHRHKKP